MKNIAFRIIAAAILIGALAGCRNNKKADNAPVEPEAETYMTAIDRYLTDSIASYYLKGEYSIPFCDFIVADESNPDRISVLGDFWVLNYDQAGDTLKCVSGGNHSGKMLIGKDAEGHFSVLSFEQTSDGSDFEPSARRIFGEKYDDFAAANSNSIERDQIRADAIARYIKRHSIPVSLYQDYGWPAIQIPKAE